MKKFNYFKQLLVMTLCFSMFVSMLYQPIYALDANNGSLHTVNTTAEDYEKEYVKHFNMNDGTTTVAATYGVHGKPKTQKPVVYIKPAIGPGASMYGF